MGMSERRHDEVDAGALLDVVVEQPGHAVLVVGRREILEEGGAAGRAAQQGHRAHARAGRDRWNPPASSAGSSDVAASLYLSKRSSF